MLEGARVGGTRKVVFASSGGTIYGEPAPAELPVKESHPQQPLSPYGVAKRVVTDYLHVYRELHAIEFTSLALANVYGPRQDPHGEAGVVAIFAGLLLAGKPCTVFGDGEQTRDFVYVDDAVDAFVRAADRGQRAAVQHRHRRRDVGERALRAPWPRPPGSTDAGRARAGPAGRAGPQRPRSRAGPSSTSAGSRGPTCPPASREVLRLVPGLSRLAAALAEQVLVRGAHDLGVHLAPAEPRRVDAAHHGGRHAGGLAHHQLGGRGQLVDDAHLGDLQLAAAAVLGAPQVDDGLDAGAADGDVGEAAPPRPPEGVATRSRPPRRRGAARRPSRMRRAERSLSSGSSAAQPSSTLDRSTPALAHTKPCLVSLMMRSPRRRRIRTDSRSTMRLVAHAGRRVDLRPSRPRPWTRPSG